MEYYIAMATESFGTAPKLKRNIYNSRTNQIKGKESKNALITYQNGKHYAVCCYDMVSNMHSHTYSHCTYESD